MGGFKPGHVFYFMSGEYSEIYDMYLGDGKYAKKAMFLPPYISGTEENPITFKADPGENPVFFARLPNTLPGESDRKDGNEIYPVETYDVHHLVFDGFEIRKTFGKGMVLRAYDSEVKNCWIHDIDGLSINNLGGISVGPGSEVNIHHNLIHDNYDRVRLNLSGNIYIGHAETVRVHDNIIYNTEPTPCKTQDCVSKGGWGIYSKYPPTNNDTELEVYKNALWNCTWHSVFTQTPKSYIHHNLIMDSTQMGTMSLANTIENNTIIRGLSFQYNTNQGYQWNEVYKETDKLYFRSNIVIDNTPVYGGTGILSMDSVWKKHMMMSEPIPV